MTNPANAVPETSRRRVVVQRCHARQRVHRSDRLHRRQPDALPASRDRDLKRKNVELPARHRTKRLTIQRPRLEDELAPSNLDAIATNGEPMIHVVDSELLVPPRRQELLRRREYPPEATPRPRPHLNERQGSSVHTPTVADPHPDAVTS